MGGKPIYMAPSPLKQLKFRLEKLEKRVMWLEAEVKRLEDKKADHEIVLGERRF